MHRHLGIFSITAFESPYEFSVSLRDAEPYDIKKSVQIPLESDPRPFNQNFCCVGWYSGA